MPGKTMPFGKRNKIISVLPAADAMLPATPQAVHKGVHNAKGALQTVIVGFALRSVP